MLYRKHLIEILEHLKRYKYYYYYSHYTDVDIEAQRRLSNLSKVRV